MKISSDTYAFVEHKGEEEVWFVKIKEGDYADITYRYGAISASEDGDEAQLKFIFNVVKAPEHFDKEDLKNDEVFCKLLGDILVHILEDALDSGNFKLGNNDKSTDSESIMHE